jgi:antitoxin component YwqK of YwqJK toxin-antitoxin module
MQSFYKTGIVFLIFLNVFCLQAQTSFNKLDEKGKKQGVWKGVYEGSKRPRYEGTFEHGKETGVFNFYDDTKEKKIIATREFNEKDNSAYTTFYDQDNNKVSEGKIANKLFEGPWKYYHLGSKAIMTTENYKKGKLEGLRSVFYADGKIAEESNYKNNLKEGFYKKYTANGIVLEESVYKNNEYHGLAIFKDVAGNVVSKGQFVNGKKAGAWQFFENGKPVNPVNKKVLKKATEPKKQ